MISKIPIFCLPFAGGGALSYKKFIDAAPDGLEFIPLTTPGKDQRLSEVLLTDMHELAAQYAQQIIDSKASEYILYGHSMGALMAHLVVQHLAETEGPVPRHMVVVNGVLAQAEFMGYQAAGVPVNHKCQHLSLSSGNGESPRFHGGKDLEHSANVQ